MSAKHASAGRVVRRHIHALQESNERPSEASDGGVPGHDPDLAQEALIRLVSRARRPGGDAWLASLLPRTDEQLGRLISRLVRHVAAEQSPERAYYRALRLHVEEILIDAESLPLLVKEPTGLQVDGRIRRELVEQGVAVLVGAMGTPLHQSSAILAAYGKRPDIVSQLTRQLTRLYPPEGVVVRGVPHVPGEPPVDFTAQVPDQNADGRAKELEFWRRRFAPKTAAEVAVLLGDDLRLVLAQLRGATLEEIARETGIPRATIADKIKRSAQILRSARLNLGSYGTVAAALKLLVSGRTVDQADGAAAGEAHELIGFLEEGKRSLVHGEPQRRSPT